MLIRKIVAALVAVGTVAATYSCVPAVADTADNATQAKSLVDKLSQSVKDAKAFDYQATFSAGNISETGVVGTPNVYTVTCKEQEPNCFRITVVDDSHVTIAEFASGKDGGIFFDAKQNRYFTFPLNSDADWGAMHAAVDKVTGGPDMGNVVDSTLIHKPMFDLEGQYHRDSPVTYSVTQTTMDGHKVSRVREQCTTDGAPMEEAVAIDNEGNLMAYSAFIVINKVPILAQRQLFKSLKLLTDPLPDSTFQFTPPAGAQRLGG
jgi:hypothetical protein